MHTKMASIWRFLRTSALFTSVTVLLISCASKNPLIDEVDKTDKVQFAAVKTEETKVDYRTKEKAKPVTPPAKNNQLDDSAILNAKPTGIKKWINIFTPYKVNVQQGNFISSEMLSKLRPGMTKEQVRFVLGTPLLTDMFHANRWDYLFRLQKPNGAITTNRVTIFFKDSLVDKIVSDDLPQEVEYIANIESDGEPSKKTKEKSNSDNAKQEVKKESDIKTFEDISEPRQQEPVKTSVPVNKPASASKSTDNAKSVNTPDPVQTPEPVKVMSEPARIISPVRAQKPAEISEPVNIPVPVRIQKNISIPVSVQKSEPINTPAPVRSPEPVKLTEPIRTPEPVNAPVPATNTESSTALPRSTTANLSPLRARPPKRPTHAVKQVESEEETLLSEKIGTFEPISIQKRIGRMTPSSPNDQLIDTIQ